LAIEGITLGKKREKKRKFLKAGFSKAGPVAADLRQQGWSDCRRFGRSCQAPGISQG